MGQEVLAPKCRALESRGPSSDDAEMACMRRTWFLTLLAIVSAASACTHGLFSPANPGPDRSRPVVRIETRGGAEYGVTTTDGILFLGRTATEGPCRVHLFIGGTPTPLIEDGTIEAAGAVFYRVAFDLKTMAVPLLDRDLATDDALIAIPFVGPFVTTEVPVRLAQNSAIDGDVIEWPDRDLPAALECSCANRADCFVPAWSLRVSSYKARATSRSLAAARSAI